MSASTNTVPLMVIGSGSCWTGKMAAAVWIGTGRAGGEEVVVRRKVEARRPELRVVVVDEDVHALGDGEMVGLEGGQQPRALELAAFGRPRWG